MEVTHTVAYTGEEFREIRSNIWKPLDELKKQYDFMGFKTWLTFDPRQKKDWLLSIQIGGK